MPSGGRLRHVGKGPALCLSGRVYSAGCAESDPFQTGPGRDITDIRFEAEIFDFRGQCNFDEDDGIWAVEVELLVQISVEKGPANRQREIELEYFVVLPAFEGKPGGKRIFTVKGQFEEGRTKLVYQDDVALNIPLKNPNDGGKTEVVFGFQLTPDELKFNRAPAALNGVLGCITRLINESLGDCSIRSRGCARPFNR